jgi:sarcosine oxidase/L-pipecolate oxidase
MMEKPELTPSDLNKIIRAGDYADPALARMAIEAVDHWRKPEWEGTYHE